jgi:phage terminase Nu1 subunit (DNA packaging protein)
MFKVHPDRISHWTKAGMPVASFGGGGGKENRYDVEACVQWKLAHGGSNGANPAPGKLNLDQERARQAAASADKTELETRVRRGELVEASRVEAEWGNLVAACRAHLLLLPRMLVQRGLIDPRREADAQDLVEDGLRQLANSEALEGAPA